MATTATAPFTDELWGSIGGIYDRILSHPFLVELVEGTLDEQAFQHYIIQDTLYIREYARVHSIAAGRAESSDDMLRFSQLASEIVHAEQTFHADFFRDWGLSDEDVWMTRTGPDQPRIHELHAGRGVLWHLRGVGWRGASVLMDLPQGREETR